MDDFDPSKVPLECGVAYQRTLEPCSLCGAEYECKDPDCGVRCLCPNPDCPGPETCGQPDLCSDGHNAYCECERVFCSEHILRENHECPSPWICRGCDEERRTETCPRCNLAAPAGWVEKWALLLNRGPGGKPTLRPVK